MSIGQEIDKAVGAHGLWKTRLTRAISSGKVEDSSPKDASSDKKCAFGTWLYGLSGNDTKSSHYNTVRTLHEKFHRVAGEILQLVVNGNKTAANLKMVEFDSASAELVNAMRQWKAAV